MRLEFRLAESGKSFGAEKNGVVRLSAGNGLPCGGKGGGKRCKREVRRAFFDLSDGFPCAKSSCFLSREKADGRRLHAGHAAWWCEEGVFL